MTFETSISPDISETLPYSLSEGEKTASQLKRGQVRWDVSIDGIGFILGINDQNPYIRESAPTQKQQFDASAEAGEQTLDGLWIRSQTSWHLGAGVNFYEPGARDGATPSQYRFKSSVGVNVWNEGDVSLLKRMDHPSVGTTGEVYVRAARASGADVWFSVHDNTLKRWSSAGVATAYTGTSIQPAGRIAICGTKVVVPNTSLGLLVGDVTGNTLSGLYNQSLGTTPHPYWCKGRIIATRGRDLFELTLSGTLSGSTPGNLDTVTPLFTHPDSGWTWTDVCEAPSAILAAGYSNGVGAIYSFTLESDTSGGSTPKLGQPFQVAEFPPGEEVRSLRVYLGTYVGIGTTRGLRVGILGNNGQVQYGPLLFKTSQPVRALAARDSYLYAGVTGEIDGGSGVARVDLGNPIGDGLLFPWAWDVQTHTAGTVRSVAFVGNTDRVVVGVDSEGAYAQSATEYEQTGYLLSGSIRYGTTENKAFRFADVRCRTSQGGSVALSVVGPSGETVPIVTLADGAGGGNLSLARLAQKLEYVSYKLTLTRSTDLTHTPTVESVALKAVPAVKKQRMIRYPVLMQDKHRDGGRAGVQRNVAELIQQLEAAESDSAVVQVVDYRLGESFPAQIESVQFTSTTPSTGSTRGQNNAGGRGEITVRKLT